tara:strand:- start:1544 stop:3652 length:2109 start_codon:yes stop_codon:yes gene_type:complete
MFKNKFLQKKIQEILYPQKTHKEFTEKEYLEDMKTGLFDDRFNLGIIESDKGLEWNMIDFFEQPHALFLGKTGSGKSASASFSLLTWFLANSHKTEVMLVDLAKGASDYNNFKKYDNVHFIIDQDPEKFFRAIHLLHKEALARSKKISDEGFSDLRDYEKKTGKKMTRYLLFMEEFHKVMTSLEFSSNFRKMHTPAQKFLELIRVGRSIGIWMVACTQRGTQDDIPTTIKSQFVNLNIFQVTPGESMYTIGDNKAAFIPKDYKSRGYSDEGKAIQFPYIPPDNQGVLLKKLYRPVKTESLTLDSKTIKSFIEDGTGDLYKSTSIVELCEAIEHYVPEKVIEELHRRWGHDIEFMGSKKNPFGLSMVIQDKLNRRVAISVRAESGQKLTGKHIENLRKGMLKHKCVSGIIYTAQNSITASLYKSADTKKDNYRLNIDILDHEDLVIKANLVENEGDEAEFNPVEMASDSKESAASNSQEPFDPPELVDDSFVMPNLEDFIIEDKSPEKIEEPSVDYSSLESSGEREVRPKSYFELPASSSPILLYRNLYTDSGEIYRTLFYIVIDKNIAHRYYIDRKILGDFNYEQLLELKVQSTSEWNNKEETLLHEEYILKIRDYLKNFEVLNFPGTVFCWEKDENFITQILENTKGLHKIPKTFEEGIFDITDENYTKAQYMEISKDIRAKNVNIYKEIDEDFQIWRQLF